mgnify:CR=1 FL=1
MMEASRLPMRRPAAVDHHTAGGHSCADPPQDAGLREAAATENFRKAPSENEGDFFLQKLQGFLIAVEMEKLKVGGMDKTTMLCNGMNHPASEYHKSLLTVCMM